MAETKAAHTPGPWKFIEAAGTHIHTEGDPYGCGSMFVAEVRGWGHLTGLGGGCAFDDEKAMAIQDANARLIAAAPELLDALKALKGYCFCEFGIGNPMYTDHSVPCRNAVAALAKAEGKP